MSGAASSSDPGRSGSHELEHLRRHLAALEAEAARLRGQIAAAEGVGDAEPRSAEAALRESEARLRAGEARQAFLLALADEMQALSEPQGIMGAAVRALARHLGVSRVGYGRVQADDATIVRQVSHTDGVHAPAGPLRMEAFGAEMLARARRGETVAVADVAAGPGFDAATWDAVHTRAFVCVPLLREGRFVAALYATHHEARAWTAHDVGVIEDVAGRTWDAVERALAEAELRASEARHRQILDGATDYAIIATDLEGRVTLWNEGARRVLGWSEDEVLGNPIERIYTPDDRERGRAAEERREALEEGRVDDRRWHQRRGGERFWAAGEMMPLRDGDAGGTHVGYVKVLRDRTDERRREQRLDLLGRASAALLTAADPAEALRPILETGAEPLGFGRCGTYELVPDRIPGSTRLVLRHAIGTPGGAADGAADLGLSDLVARTGRPLLVTDLAESAQPSHAAAAAAGLRAYAGFPILSGGTPRGALAFASPRPAAFDAEVLAVLAALARLLSIARERLDGLAALRASEAELRLVTDALPVLVAFLDRSLTYRFANAAYEPWTGRPIERIVGHSIAEVLGPAEYAARLPHMERALAGTEVRFERDWPTPDGQSRETETHYLPRRDPDGTIGGFYVLVQDISDRKRTEDVLALRADRLEAQVAERTRDRDRIWTLSPVLKVVAAPGGAIQAVNPSWTRTLGWPEERAVGREIAEFVVPEERAAVTAALAATVAAGAPREFEATFATAEGDAYAPGDGPRRIGWTFVPEEGTLYGFGRDLTEQRQAEEALRQAQKLEAVGQLTGGVAHDFNNLLTIIRSSVDFLRRRDLPEERRRRYIDAVSDTVDRAAKLTGQLLAFARRQALKPEVFEVGVCLRAVSDMLDTIMGARITVTTQVPEARCYVRADLSQFETALVNMAVNARDAMSGEGRLVLKLSGDQPLPPLRGHAGNSGRFAVVSLTDTGSGIAPDVLARVFEPFFTTKEVGRGTGLGLSQVFGFAKQSGGDVAVESTPGRGTTFTLYLPAIEPERGEAAAADEADDDAREPIPRGGGRRVLVVEDNVEIGRFATQTLEDLGYVATWAANAGEALAHLEAGARAGEDPERAGFDAVFSDVVMPGMNGVELGREIRRRHARLPVVLTSGYSHVLAEEGRHGFELLHKPYSVEQLSRVLRQAMRRRRAPAGS